MNNFRCHTFIKHEDISVLKVIWAPELESSEIKFNSFCNRVSILFKEKISKDGHLCGGRGLKLFLKPLHVYLNDYGFILCMVISKKYYNLICRNNYFAFHSISIHDYKLSL